MITTGKFDVNNKEIFVGDKILKSWGWIRYLGEVFQYFSIHTINEVPIHKLASGDMCESDTDHGTIFICGRSYNRWKGKDVKKLNDDEINQIDVPEDTNFFFGPEGKGIILTDQHFMNLTYEEWIVILTQREYQRIAFFIGDPNNLGGTGHGDISYSDADPGL